MARTVNEHYSIRFHESDRKDFAPDDPLYKASKMITAWADLDMPEYKDGVPLAYVMDTLGFNGDRSGLVETSRVNNVVVGGDSLEFDVIDNFSDFSPCIPLADALNVNLKIRYNSWNEEAPGVIFHSPYGEEIDYIECGHSMRKHLEDTFKEMISLSDGKQVNVFDYGVYVGINGSLVDTIGPEPGKFTMIARDVFVERGRGAHDEYTLDSISNKDLRDNYYPFVRGFDNLLSSMREDKYLEESYAASLRDKIRNVIGQMQTEFADNGRFLTSRGGISLNDPGMFEERKILLDSVGPGERINYFDTVSSVNLDMPRSFSIDVDDTELLEGTLAVLEDNLQHMREESLKNVEGFDFKAELHSVLKELYGSSVAYQNISEYMIGFDVHFMSGCVITQPTRKEAIEWAKRSSLADGGEADLSAEVEASMNDGLSPAEALREWDVEPFRKEVPDRVSLWFDGDKICTFEKNPDESWALTGKGPEHWDEELYMMCRDRLKGFGAFDLKAELGPDMYAKRYGISGSRLFEICKRGLTSPENREYVKDAERKCIRKMRQQSMLDSFSNTAGESKGWKR